MKKGQDSRESCDCFYRPVQVPETGAKGESANKMRRTSVALLPKNSAERRNMQSDRRTRCPDAARYTTMPGMKLEMSEAVRTLVQGSAGTAPTPASEADPGFLWDFWYPAALSTKIRDQKLTKALLLEVPLVLGRTAEGKVFAMRDSCPHRGIPLSC